MGNVVTVEAVEARVREILAELGTDLEEIDRDATFESLDVDSLDLVELGQIIEEEYGIELTTEDAQQLRTVGQAIDLITQRAQ
ncbi:MAG: acyl carrier protein [Conexibacter sp.]